MFSDGNDTIISKQCSYNGQLNVELTDNCFSFYPTFGIRQMAVFYDISGYREQKLKMNLKRSTKGPSKIGITLLEIENSSHEEEILEIVLETLPLMMDTLKEEYYKIRKSLQMFGSYSISSRGKIIKAVFDHADGTHYTIMVNGSTKIYDAYKWLCGIWTPRCECTEYCISTKDGIADLPRTFVDYADGGVANFTVAEKCYAHPMIDSSPLLCLPWNKQSSVLLGDLATMLGLAPNDVRLMNDREEVLREGLKLDIDLFRISNTKEPPVVRYDISKTVVKCVSMRNNADTHEVAILRECNVAEMKIRLGQQLSVDPRCFILSDSNKLLTNEKIIDPANEIKYYICSILDRKSLGPSVGKGGFGEVFILNAGSEERAMKKFIFPTDDDRSKMEVSFIREIMVLFTVPRHGNLVHYYELHVDERDIYIEMEYVAGGSLRNYIKEKKALDEELVRKYSRDILNGLDHLHQNKVHHRDIKSDNVLLTRNKMAKLCDFGISRILSDYNSRECPNGVQQTQGFGTWRYMAPEVINGSVYEFKTDIWAVGATIIEMVTGELPHGNLEESAVLYKVGNDKKIDYQADISVELRQIIDACLRPEPRDRPKARVLLEYPFFAE